jgi:hypothetical protein
MVKSGSVLSALTGRKNEMVDDRNRLVIDSPRDECFIDMIQDNLKCSYDEASFLLWRTNIKRNFLLFVQREHTPNYDEYMKIFLQRPYSKSSEGVKKIDVYQGEIRRWKKWKESKR